MSGRRAGPALLLLAAAVASCAPRPAAGPGPAAAAAGADASSPAAPGRLDLFLLAGQSNMAGRGKVEPEDRVPHPRVWMLDREERWVPAVDPVHFDKPIAGVGPGRSFGIAVAEAEPDARVGLVPAAVGGSPITSWEPGALDPATGTHPYDDALRRARRAQSDGTLRAILWHQGESDSNPRAAPEYARRLRALIARFRADLHDPGLPFLIGEMGRFDARPWDAPRVEVDSAQRAVAAEDPRVVYVSSAGLVDRGDTLHFSAASARALGRRYAEAYLALTASGAGR